MSTLSLKATQKENQFCVCVDENTKLAMKDKYKEVFDYVVDILNDDAGSDKNGKYITSGKFISSKKV